MNMDLVNDSVLDASQLKTSVQKPEPEKKYVDPNEDLLGLGDQTEATSPSRGDQAASPTRTNVDLLGQSMGEKSPQRLVNTQPNIQTYFQTPTDGPEINELSPLNPINPTNTVRSNLTGIYAFFNSSELPPNPKAIMLSDIPIGHEGIPFIFQNRCYSHGIGLMNQYMNSSTTVEEKMYYKILKIMCLVKQSMWPQVQLEFSTVGNLDKIVTELKSEAFAPFQLRFLHALTPFLSAPVQKGSHASVQAAAENKTLDRLFCLLSFCEKKAGDFTYEDGDLFEVENLDMFVVCDADISQKQWIARIFRVTLTILEILLFRASTTITNEVIRTALERFPKNELLMSYFVRLKKLQGDTSDCLFFIEKMNNNLPKDEFLEFITFNSFLQKSLEMKIEDSKSLLEELGQKFPQYSTLAQNNLAYLLIAEGKIVEAIDVLEQIIRTEPWNINEVIVLNLFCLYDFYYVESGKKKKIIWEIIDRYASNFNKELLMPAQKA